MGSYGEHDRARVVAEQGRTQRSAFQRDHARIVHSEAFRRLADKTQVVVAGQDDFPRTRLTHSLECAQVGREMAAALGSEPDVVEVGCLAHDAGHPPFGHNGEDALNEIAQACGGFEGNAQSFRLLTRIEAKRFDATGASVGLNLTRACLDAATKYPWQRHPGSAKFGVYSDDEPIFTWMREGAPVGQRCFEAQVMDWADDVAYSVHDVEDAVHLGVLHVREMGSDSFVDNVVQVATHRFHTEPEQAQQAVQRLIDLPEWRQAQQWEAQCDCQPSSNLPHSCLASSRAGAAALKNLTSRLIGRFARSAELATRQECGQGPLVRYQAHLVIPEQQRAECDVLKAAAAQVMMLGPQAQQRYQQERRVLHTVADAFSEARVQPLDPLAREQLRMASGDQARMRAVVDAVAGLTDTSALALYARLSAQ